MSDFELQSLVHNKPIDICALADRFRQEIAQGRQPLLLTPNTRLASHVQGLLEQQQANFGETTWVTPTIEPINAWLEKCWRQRLLAGKIAPSIVLSAQQEAWYWQTIIQDSSYSENLLSVSATAALAQQAFHLLCQWQVNLDEAGDNKRFEFSSLPDSQALLHWIDEFKQRTSAKQQLSLSQSHRVLADSLELENSLELDINSLEQDIENKSLSKLNQTAIFLLGFQAPTPLQERLVLLNAGAKHNIHRHSLQCERKTVAISTAIDFEDEIQQAAWWAKQTKEQQPRARIAVVIQDLTQNRSQVERVFLNQFEPQALQLEHISSASTFNLSAGRSLASTPTISIALTLLSAFNQKLHRDEWLALLTSPYIGPNNPNTDYRQQLITRLFDTGLAELDVFQVARLFDWKGTQVNRQNQGKAAGEKEALSTPEFQQTLLSACQLSRELKLSGREKALKQQPSAWLLVFKKIFALFNCPDARSPNSDEFQQIERFKIACENFESLDVVTGSITFNQALSCFYQTMRQTVYHRETPALEEEGPIVQVLGGLEASGQLFDYIWLVGMSDRQWPNVVRPNPLIPRALQLALQMPSASIDKEFHYASEMTNNFLHAAGHCIVSYPKTIDDVPCQLSPLFNAYAAVSYNTSNLASKSDSQAEHCTNYEYVEDFSGFALNHNTVSGGVNTLEDQAACPFRAYIKRRVLARPLTAITRGISPLDRGNIVHEALDIIWQTLGGSAALKDSSDKHLHALIQEATDRAFQQVSGMRFEAIAPRLESIERERLQALLFAWLQLEKDRPDFIVHALEEKIQAQYGGLEWHLRIDRRDTLHIDNEGKRYQLLIDYKTGAVSNQLKGWHDERLSSPQLPFYELLLEQSTKAENVQNSCIAAISFASLKYGELAYQGVCSEQVGDVIETPSAKIKPINKFRSADLPDWTALTTHWAERLDNLIDEVKQGHAVIDPINNACSHCEFSSVCRINQAVVGDVND